MLESLVNCLIDAEELFKLENIFRIKLSLQGSSRNRKERNAQVVLGKFRLKWVVEGDGEGLVVLVVLFVKNIEVTVE